ncbi:MAG: PfkB family carbohydrate kinase [Lapillicoccus sp.]
MTPGAGSLASRRPVVVVGDVGIDVLTRPRTPIVPGGESPSDIALVPGGAGGNTAAWLVRHGVDAALVARIGDDQAGTAARGALERLGVRCIFAVDQTLPTCVVVVLVDDAGERTMLSDRGANKAFGVADVDLDAAALGPAHLHLSGYVLFDPSSRDAGLAALAGAQERGWTTSVDPQAAELVTAVGAEAFLGWVDGVDLLLPNEVEIEALGGTEAVLAHVGIVAVTYGAGGARWFTAASSHDEHVEAPAITCIDSTGAGDAFNAGLLASWLGGALPAAALAAGVSAGSTAAADVGARPA